MGNLCRSGRAGGDAAPKLNRMPGGRLCQARCSTMPVLVLLLQAGSALGLPCEGAPAYMGIVRRCFSGL